MKTSKFPIVFTFCESDIIAEVIGIYCLAPYFYHVKKNMTGQNKGTLRQFGKKIARAYWNIFFKNTRLVKDAKNLPEIRERLNHISATIRVRLKELRLTLMAFRASFNEYSYSVDYRDLEIYTDYPIVSIVECYKKLKKIYLENALPNDSFCRKLLEPDSFGKKRRYK